ncbi:hypothetical protein J5N97_002514 [Dioscorea zingiberensis]|uniref:Acidic protein n=1 Tax=Dioscorea zingiberensis TaxID=325984 RepID=A0A9D5D4W7_9LILI|nr:hypothetical protein J5N97_002514 [Dioscorea zingiberensis]
MEGKGVRVPFDVVVLVVLILGLNLAQTQVEAVNICCWTISERICYNHCRRPPEVCAKECGCIISSDPIPCPRNYSKLHFCKLGCASFMCSTISTLENSDVTEKAMIGCNKKCSEFCNEGNNEGSDAVFTA